MIASSAKVIHCNFGFLMLTVVFLSLSAIHFFSAGQLIAAEKTFEFRDTGEEAGLFPALDRIAGHGVGWGDADGDGYPELYVGTFGGHPYDSKPNQFFRNVKGKFVLDEQKQLQVVGRANGAVFVDFDNDGDLDLYITNHAIEGKQYGQPHYEEPNHLFRNEGGGKFTDVSADSGCCPALIAARSVTTLDYDGDGLLDLLVGECFFQGGMSRTRLYRNLGGLKFQNTTTEAGLPEQLTGFGVAASDVTADGWPDLFAGGRHQGNRLFINDQKGHFQEVPSSLGNFQWEFKDTPDDTTCGVAIGDVNRDGRPDILVGSHCDRPWWTGGIPVRLYQHRGMEGNLPRYEDVTQAAGLIPLPMKSPHVEIQDFDNDGWPDVYTSIVKFAGDTTVPMIFQNLGAVDGAVKFREEMLAVNDFPTDEDRQMQDVGAFFAKLERDHKCVYTAPGPSGDYDRDGRLDLFLANWWVNQRSILLHNETKGGHWLDVTINGSAPVNRQGIGCQIWVYRAGQLGKPEGLVGMREIAVGFGYASGQEAVAHFGLGDQTACDLEVVLPHGRGKKQLLNVQGDQRLQVSTAD
ncbi:MAG: CRTAC1 family protein [Planctomycetaceae bacterium]